MYPKRWGKSAAITVPAANRADRAAVGRNAFAEAGVDHGQSMAEIGDGAPTMIPAHPGAALALISHEHPTCAESAALRRRRSFQCWIDPDRSASMMAPC